MAKLLELDSEPTGNIRQRAMAAGFPSRPIIRDDSTLPAPDPRSLIVKRKVSREMAVQYSIRATVPCINRFNELCNTRDWGHRDGFLHLIGLLDREEEIGRREKELDRREAELQRREAALAKTGG